MQDQVGESSVRGNRRAFIKGGGLATGGAAIALGLLAKSSPAWANGVTKGDIAILTFLAAVETIETDLWLQYAELGGVPTTKSQDCRPGEVRPIPVLSTTLMPTWRSTFTTIPTMSSPTVTS
jgi:hypothetical protein